MQTERQSVFEELKRVDALVDHLTDGPMVEEILPFTVRVVRNETDLRKAVDIRQSAYARHLPELAEALAEPEMDDTKPDTVVLLAESKLDGSVLGSVRIQANWGRPLNMERAITLPKWLQGQSIAEVRRLAIVRGTTGRLVKLILVKACFQYCEINNIDWALLGTNQTLKRGYEQLMFSDILDGTTFLLPPPSNDVPHSAMAFEISTGHARWKAAKHPLLRFFSYTHHPDIDVGRVGVSKELHAVAHLTERLRTARAANL